MRSLIFTAAFALVSAVSMPISAAGTAELGELGVAASAPGASRTPPAPEGVLDMPEALRKHFREQLRNRSQVLHGRALDDLVDYLFKPEGLGMRYRHDATYTVAEAWETREANCLTFTLLTVALARDIGLTAYGQEISDTVAWRQDGNTVFRTHHINAGVIIAPRRYTIDVASNEVIARDPPTQINDARLLAHYFNNRAAELMSEGELEPAEAFARVSLQLDPAYASSWSNLGVIHLRQGDAVAAESDYQRALSLDDKHPGALFNLSAHYRRSGQQVRAASLQSQLEAVQNKDPFHHFLRALDLEEAGEARAAAHHFRRAIRLHPYEHRFYFGLARAYLMQGQNRRADKALELAYELSEGHSRDLYQAKIDLLRKHEG